MQEFTIYLWHWVPLASIVACLLFALLMFGLTKRLWPSLIFGTAVAIWMYVKMPVFCYGFYEGPIILTVIGGFSLITNLIFEKLAPTPFTQPRFKWWLWKISSALILIGAIFSTVVPWVANSEFIREQFGKGAFYQAIGQVEEGTFTKDVPPINIAKVLKVNEELAANLGEKPISHLGSIAQLGAPSIQTVAGERIYAIPLSHIDTRRYLASIYDGAPGYVVVSTINLHSYRLVTEINSQPIRLRYNMGVPHWSMHHPLRYLYQRGIVFHGLTDCSFELDDSWRPFWVVTRYRKKVGYTVEDADGVAILDAQTGAVTEYGPNNIPNWVDRHQPREFFVKQINYWGQYVHSWLNANFDKQDVIQTSGEAHINHDGEDRCYWYVGMTSIGKDQSTVGFVLCDTKTKKTKIFRQSGATELAAQRSLEGAVQDQGYKARNVFMYNPYGIDIPTYFGTLHDESGLVKQVGWVSTENHEIVGVGETEHEAFQRYLVALKKADKTIKFRLTDDLKTVRGRVERKIQNSRNGLSYWQLIITGQAGKTFNAFADLSLEIAATKEGADGDEVEIRYYDNGGANAIDIIFFDNLQLQLNY